jgi:hypothetical protein
MWISFVCSSFIFPFQIFEQFAFMRTGVKTAKQSEGRVPLKSLCAQVISRLRLPDDLFPQTLKQNGKNFGLARPMFTPFCFTSFISSSSVLRSSLRRFLLRLRSSSTLHYGFTLRFKPARPLFPFATLRGGLAGTLLRNLFRSFHSLHKMCPYSVVFPLVTLTEY